ncbi:MAG TPA: nucleotidyltransferase domain-containing protein [Polyangiales bacterium]
MKRDAAFSILSGCAGELRDRFGVTELSLFGSVARDEARDTSDVDVLVSFAVSPRSRRSWISSTSSNSARAPGSTS